MNLDNINMSEEEYQALYNRIKTDLEVQSAEEIKSNIYTLLEKYGLANLASDALSLNKKVSQIKLRLTLYLHNSQKIPYLIYKFKKYLK